MRGNTRHQQYGTPTYRSWTKAKARCFNPNVPQYRFYGGRGIGMCSEWRDSFEAFLRDMGERPEGTSLDRIDSNGHYEPGNCRWADKLTQANNTRSNRFMELRGERKTMAEWARVFGLNYQSFHDMIERGRTLDHIAEWVSSPTRGFSVLLAHGGETLGVREWARKTGIPAGTIRARIRQGWPTPDVLTRPVDRRNRIASQSA